MKSCPHACAVCLSHFRALDLFLIRGIHEDPVKRAVVAGMLGVASQIGGKVIAEGLEPLTVTTVMTDSTLFGSGY